MTRITTACPKALFDDYIALRRCHVTSRAEADAPPDAVFAWRNAGGTLFAVSSVEGGATWLSSVLAPVVLPEWGADLVAAERAQARVILWSKTETGAATDDRITIVSGLTGPAALAAIGLTPVTEDGPI